ncbi:MULTISPECIES: hypothetical protein [unclassified Paenibacillus]|uniref:hypothetical protein n=1 Tax=unclassified Paenibacillus TaxID=185978 RepID=UPI0011159A23|nr:MULTISPECIES: hypothetical protein [unclassified Paenibacillus]ASS69025.2 hypothetical protein CIC07_25045 [Paenibacillus sp. RUD330]
MKRYKASLALLLWTSLLFGALSPSVSAADPIAPLPRLGIYYGWPSLVNGAAGNLTTAANTFKQFDVVVFGDGIEHASHGDHANTTAIMGDLKAAGKKVFGYVDLGVSTQNLSLATIQTYVDEWKSMGAFGIFLDDYGFDYGVTRARQNAVLTYIHNAGLKAFMNAWNIDEAMGNRDETGASNPPSVTAGDYYLAESWLVSGNAYQSVSAWSAKADKALAYYRSKGVVTAALSTNAPGAAAPSDSSTDRFKMAWWAAAMYGFPFQWTDLWYSASNNTLNVYSNPSGSYGTSFLSDPVHQSGSSVNTRTSNTGTITVSGDGSSTGTGGYAAAGSSYPSIAIDGNASDWSGIAAAASGTTTAQILKAANDASSLKLLVQGSGLNVKSQFYINADNNTATGYSPSGWTAGGADYLVENNVVYKNSGTGWSWTAVRTLAATGSDLEFSKSASVIELKIPLSALGLAPGAVVRIGYIKNDSAADRLPGANGTMPSITLLP